MPVGSVRVFIRLPVLPLNQLHFANSLAFNVPALIPQDSKLQICHLPWFRPFQIIHTSQRFCVVFCYRMTDYGMPPLVDICNCLFSAFTVTLHIWRLSPP